MQSLGSGFVIDAEGIIVTNNHVVDGADESKPSAMTARELKAELVGRDQKVDIAVLRVMPDKPTCQSWNSATATRRASATG